MTKQQELKYLLALLEINRDQQILLERSDVFVELAEEYLDAGDGEKCDIALDFSQDARNKIDFCDRVSKKLEQAKEGLA